MRDVSGGAAGAGSRRGRGRHAGLLEAMGRAAIEMDRDGAAR